MVEIIKNLCPEGKYAIKCPFLMTPKRIVIHNTANDAPAENEVSYMLSRPGEVSFHFAVDDEKIVQGIPLNRNAWHAGDGQGEGNLEGIAIEICYSLSGGEKWLKAVNNAAELTAKLMKDYNIPIELVTKHQDYSGKNCPHRILDEYGWENFINLIRKYVDEKPNTEVEVVTAPDVIYAAHFFKGPWLPDVTNYNDVNYNGYAGIVGKPIDGIRARLTKGNIVYRVHTVGGKYLDWVRDLDKAQAGYAGLYGYNIDGVQMYLENLPGFAVEYRVAPIGKPYLAWVRNYKDNDPNGYAGIYGKSIDRVQIRIVKI